MSAANRTFSRSQLMPGVERHVLDEPQLQAVLAAEPGQRDDVVLGHARGSRRR